VRRVAVALPGLTRAVLARNTHP
jgi:hypothetical protein